MDIEKNNRFMSLYIGLDDSTLSLDKHVHMCHLKIWLVVYDNTGNNIDSWWVINTVKHIYNGHGENKYMALV